MRSHPCVYLTLILLVVFTPRGSHGNLGQGWIEEYLMDLGLLLKNGYPAAGIPKTDPLPIHLHLNIANDMFRGTVGLDGDLSGFSNFFVSNATLNPDLFVNLDLIFYSTTFQGSYALDASVYKGIVPLSGGGPITIYFSFIELAANGTLVAQNQMVQMKNFNFEIKHINAVQVTAEGILKEYGLDEVFEAALKNILGTTLKLYKSKLENSIINYVMTDGNLALRNVTLSKILEIIKELMGVNASPIAQARSRREVLKKPPSELIISKLWTSFLFDNKFIQ